MVADFALLLPITSRGSGGVGIRSSSDIEEALREFCESLKKTTFQSDSIRIFVGVDAGDPLLDTTKNDPRGYHKDVIARVFEDEAIPWETIICEVKAPSKRLERETSDAPHPAKGQVCSVWRKLAKTAFEQGAAYAVLVGDDVRFLSAGWTSEIKTEFSALHREAFPPSGAAGAGVPVGFGVLCFTDVGSPGFPGFPVLHRTHLDIFGEIFPAAFINQDADPWIFQVYLRFGAARLMPNATLVNTVGGCQGDASRHAVPRYQKVAIDWKTNMLQEGVRKVKAWLNSRLLPPTPPGDRYRLQPFVILDVLVPSVRLDDLTVLRKICSLKVPDFMRTSFIIIIDDPTVADKDMKVLTRTLQQEAAPHACRVRKNEFNIGAGPSRNRALDESSADFVLFLDDDVHPAANILQIYGHAVQTRLGNEYSAGTPRLVDDESKRGICGFIGKTAFPPTETSLQRAVLISDVTYMYGISDAIAYPAWGVTANLLVRVVSDDDRGGAQRWTTRFGDNFPKTGGGEDVDFCLRHQRDTKGTFAALPSAVVTHPWWSGGRLKTYRRFAKWSSGDGQLMDLHSEFAYRDVPNVAESIILAPFLTVFLISAIRAASFLGNCASSGDITPMSSQSDVSRSLHSLACNLSNSSRADGPSPFEELPRLIAATLAAPLAVLLSEMACDVYRNMFDQARREDRLPALTRLARVAAAAEASLVITTLEFGRLWGHWARGGVFGLLASFGWRFDWHCSRLAGATESERKRSRSKIVLHVVFVASAWSLVMHV